MAEKGKSSIWLHFDRVKDAEGKTVAGKCNYCKSEKAMSSGSTGNLSRHLKSQHPSVPLQREVTSVSNDTNANGNESHPIPSSSKPAVSQRPLTNFFAKPLDAQGNKTLDNQLLKMICKEYHPFSIVEDREFQKFVGLLNPSYKLPSRKTLTNSYLPAVYNNVFESVQKLVNTSVSICLTCDGWTSATNVSYYALTAHFFGENTELKSVLLECSEFPDRHTAENIATWIKNVLNCFSIDDKIGAIVTDNAANIKLAAKILGIPHLSCFAHTLNLIVQNAIAKSIKEVVDTAKSVVQFFKKSSHALSKLSEMQRNMDMEELKLKQDVPTRWNATYDMLNRLLRNKQPAVSTLALISSDLAISPRQWTEMEHAVGVLKPFYEVTTEISAEKNVSLSKTAVLARILMNSTTQCKDSESFNKNLQKLQELLVDGLERRFLTLEKNELVAQCVLLDPRFKKEGFGDDENFASACSSLISKISDSTSSNATSEEDMTATELAATPASSLWSGFDAKIKKQRSIDPSITFRQELDKFLSEPHLCRTSDPAKWWDDRKQFYPNLYKVVLSRLNIPATSVPCERIFSKTGEICCDKRSRLLPEHVQKVIFINHNI